ncbi:hypothetical protein DV738_g3781, partial [Chaetothyriales sp. CBS 135597]
MLTTSDPPSGLGRASRLRTNGPVAAKDDEKEALWVPLLNSVSKGKDLPEKQLLILGGTPEQQREFLEHVNPDSTRPRYNDRRNHTKAPISNRYALGYTYQDVLDADQEDTLARLNIYMLSTPSALFGPLLKPLLTPRTVEQTLITILLDWSEPQRWARQLRQWIRLLRSVILSLDDDVKIAMEENINAWKERRVGPESPSHSAEQKTSAVPVLGPGEWDEALGIPLSIVCTRSELIYTHEREADWGDEHFDSAVQWLRCIALKHGASLIYTSSSDSNNLRTLLHSQLGISSLLKREIAKPNYLDKDKILVPPNWDSWGKIRPIHEGTDLEAISQAWSIEIQARPEERPDFSVLERGEAGAAQASAVSLYEASLPALQSRSVYSVAGNPGDEAVTVPSVQDFLKSQLPILESLKAEDEREASKISSLKAISSPALLGADGSNKPSTNIAELTGPYRRNVNGIDFDAEEAIRRLRERDAAREASRSERSGAASRVGSPSKKGYDDGKTSNEAMSAFFANLIKKDKKAVVASGSPSRGTPSSSSSSTPQDFLTSLPRHLPTPPFIHVAGIANFRDCGGYECAPPPDADLTIGARYMVRRGVLFRCAHPTNLTPAGARTLRDELGITDFFDLRTDPPLDTSQGFVVIPGISRTFTPVYAQEDYSPVALARKTQWYTTANGQGKDYSEGFDRTGVLAAIILRLCGVPDPVIQWEYAITEPGLGDWRKVFIDHISRRGLGGGGARDKVLDGEFGGVDRYLTEMVGLSAREVEGLRKGLAVEVAQDSDIVQPVEIAGWTVEKGMLEDNE